MFIFEFYAQLKLFSYLKETVDVMSGDSPSK